VMPATNDYGNPMKVYEYMAIGKAVIAPNQPTITEIATHGEDSFLFEPENIASLSAALHTLVCDAALREKLGRSGSRRAMENSWIKRATILQDAMYRLLPERN
jgi:glycosyltransferase involved in cell wall biosynthesis